MNRENKDFLVDICGTIYKSNTTLDFIRYFWSKSLKVKILLSLPFRVFSRLMYITLHKEPLRIGLISMLKGIPREQLLEMSEKFYHDFLEERTNTEVTSVIKEKRDQGYQLILLSATLDVIAEVVSKKMDIPFWLSSELAYSSDNKCLGKLKNDLLSNKLGALREKLMCDTYSGIITDNYGDAPLIEVSKAPYLVCYGSSKDRWKKCLNKEILERCQYIEV